MQMRIKTRSATTFNRRWCLMQNNLYKLLKTEAKAMTARELVKFERNLRSTIPPAIREAARLARGQNVTKVEGKDEQ